jgi:hypothetical protein
MPQIPKLSKKKFEKAREPTIVGGYILFLAYFAILSSFRCHPALQKKGNAIN